MGNHPNVDIMVSSPLQVPFSIDVKGLYKKNPWAVRKKLSRIHLFYVFAYVPDEDANRFFVLTQAQVNKEVDDEISRARARAIAKNRSDKKMGAFPVIRWRFAERYENAWASFLSEAYAADRFKYGPRDPDLGARSSIRPTIHFML